MEPTSARSFFVYIVRCSNGSLYVKHTLDVQERLKAHDEGRDAVWTACRLPVELVTKSPMKPRRKRLHGNASSNAGRAARNSH